MKKRQNSRGGTWGIAAVIPKYLSLRLPEETILEKGMEKVAGMENYS